MRFFCTFLLVMLGIHLVMAQTAKDITVPMTATLNTGPTSITLSWPNPGGANLLVLRRTKGQAGNSWSQVINLTNSNLTSVTDNGVANGLIYEYVIQRTINNFNAFGYAHVAVNANPVNTRGKILIFVDSTSATGASAELEQLYNDMRGDGWWPIPFLVGPSATVQSVKSQIVAAYNADVLNTKSVLLIGNVPIPYSGNAAWDGHVPDHEGAWPCDSYYGDVNGVWTDATVDNVVPNRVANKNVPGDGKFDQNFNPSAIELQVGRIDFRRIDAAAFGAPNQLALLKRYLQKDHRWRTGEYTVDNKALVDDNFGYFGGEAFAANGYRNAYPLVGEANIVEADYFLDTDPQSYLMGFGCGGGSYNSAGGVGSSANFATDSVNIVFANLFGSYFGDWDFETNPFMVSALASRGGILTCAWAGRPHHFYHALASGETIGYVMWETMNAQFNNGYYGSFGESGAHIALLGDPTLRANVVKPAKNLVISTPTCKSVVLDWTASADVVTGYHVYRALSPNGPYTRLTTTPVNAISYTDNNPPLDTLYYQVRAIKNVTNPGGGTYANNATGVLGSVNFVGAGGPAVTATGSGALNCLTPSVSLNANATPGPVSSWNWSGPNSYSSTLQNPTVTAPGVYTVTATDNLGCNGTASVTVMGDFTAPTIVTSVSNSINCAQSSAIITVSQTGLSSCTISGPNGFLVQGFEATVTQAGTYQVIAASATTGCTGTVPVLVNLDTAPPASSASNNGPISCLVPSAILTASSNVPNATFSWGGPCLINNTASCPGIYTVTVTNTSNGCTSSASTIVEGNTTPPTVTAQDALITCNTPTVPLLATWTPANATVQWTGPCVIPGNPSMAECPGQYTVVVTRADNGCTASAVAVVLENTNVPIINIPPAPPLTCSTPCYALTVPNLPNMEIYVGGILVPPGTSFEICAPGTYPVTVKSLLNGCTSDVSLVITQDITPPTVDAGADAVISCNTPSTQLSGSGSGTLQWNGPDGFVSSSANPVVTQLGVYELTATNPSNGCTATDQAVVTSDGSLPTVNAAVSGELNCANQTVNLLSGNNDPNATFAWTGPDGFSSTLPNPVVSEPGDYTVVVTVGACNASDAVTVIQADPLLVETIVTPLPCDVVAEVCLIVTGGTEPYVFQWSNGGNQPCAQFGNSGIIGVTVTDAGGCVYSANQNIVIPAPLSVVLSSQVNCTGLDNVCATVSGGTAPYTYHWSNNTNANCASFPGNTLVSLTVTDAVGCTQTATITISQTPVLALTLTVTDASGANVQDGAISTTVGGGSGSFVFNWSNGATTEDLNNIGAGTYTLIVVDAASGCTITGTATVNVSVGTEEAAWLSQFQLSPNPTDGLSQLQLRLHQPTDLLVEVHAMTGQLVWTSASQFTDQLVLPIDLSQSPSGLYTVSVKLANQVFVRKLSVIGH